MSRYILALDQGTTSSRAILFDRSGNIIQMTSRNSRSTILSPAAASVHPREGHLPWGV